MTDNKPAPPPKTAKSAKSAKQTANTKPSQSNLETSGTATSKSHNFIAHAVMLFTLLCAVIALVLAAWNRVDQKALQKVTSEQVSKTDTAGVEALAGLKPLAAQVGSLTDASKAQQDELQQIKKTLAEARMTLQATRQQFREVSQLDRQDNKDWLLDEALYLIRLAQYQLQFMHDVPSSIALLHSADKRLAQAASLQTVAVRQAIADEIQTLQALPKYDRVGLLTKLNSLITKISKLPLAKLTPAALTDQSGQASKPQLPSKVAQWRQALNKSWGQLKQFIIIRHDEKPIAPLWDQHQAVLIRQNQVLLLQEAKYAVLQNNQQLFDSSLKQFSDNLRFYFDRNAPLTNSLLQAVAPLQQMKLVQQYPNLASIETKLQRVIKQRDLSGTSNNQHKNSKQGAN